jgi:hypothetical protein
MKFVPAQLGICSFEFVQRVQTFYFFGRGGAIMQVTKLIVRATLYFAGKNYFHFN